MKLIIELICVLTTAICVMSESTQSFKDVVAPLARSCMSEAEANEDDFQTILHRNPLETRTAKCLLACVYGKLGAFTEGGVLLNGDSIMPIMDRLYGFKEFKTVMRAQAVHNCVDEVNGSDDDKCELVRHLLHCILQHY